MLKCNAKGCNYPIYSNGYCTTHFTRLRRTGKINPIKKKKGRPRNPPNFCKFGGCMRAVASHGYCAVHNLRLRRHGDPSKTKISPPYKGRPCKVENCIDVATGHGYCTKHYSVWARLGSHIDLNIFGKPPFVCYICGKLHKKWNTSLLQVDHIKSTFKGGKSNPENLALACKDCNTGKGTRSMRELLIWCKTVIDFHS